MPRAINRRVDLLLALLYSGEGKADDIQSPTPVVGITRLEKLLFLLKMEAGFLADAPQADDFTFIPFRMGPWSNQVYDEVDFLESLGLLSKQGAGPSSPADEAHDEELFSEVLLDKYQKGVLQPDDRTVVYSLTDQGRAKALELWKRLPTDERRLILEIKRRYNNMNLKQFLRYVYQKYPEFATASEILEDLGS